jgi:hypothetical protein
MGERRGAYGVLVGRAERDHLEHILVDGTIILKWFFKTLDGKPSAD